MWMIPFLIMLREGIEAALIVGIVAGFLKQSGQSHLMPKVWAGVILAALLCLALGIVIEKTTGQFPQKQQEFIESIIAFFAVGMLTYMIFWMKKAARSIKGELQQSLAATLNRGNGQGWALVGFAFLAVAREGLESVFFLLAVFQQSSSIEMPIGAILGLVCAVFIGVLIYQGGVRLNLARFFRWTGAFLVVVAAGLLAGGVRSLHEAGVWNHFQGIAFHWGDKLSEDSPLGVLLGGFFGYTDHPSWSELIVWLAYLVPALAWFLHSTKAPAPAAPKQAS